jgi:hypothetical protein
MKPLPSKIKSMSTPVVAHETRISSLSGSRIRAWRSKDIEEQQRLYLQSKQEETYWKIRMKNRP